jgi:iron complex transport system substrate-binding protein
MLKNFTLPSLCILALMAGAGCRDRHTRQAPADSSDGKPRESGPNPKAAAPAGGLRYAGVFSLDRQGDTTIVQVRKPWQGSASDYTYLLVPRRDSGRAEAGDPVPAGKVSAGKVPDGKATLIIPIPVRRAVTLTTTNLYHLKSIGALDALVGLGGGRYVCDPDVRARLASGRIRDVGEDVRLDAEALLALRPEVLFTYVVGNSSDGGLAKLAETGVPAVVEGSYMEETPLGRAEWIKFTAAFFGQGAAADSVFAAVDSAYQDLAARARGAKRRPTVVVGAPFGGAWWVPSGRTYVARLLADAGAEYLWAADTTRGSLNLDMEAVLARAGEAEFWLNGGDWKDLGDAKRKDPRNALFRAWREGRIYNNDAGRCEGGGRDFFETGASRPDWILADLIAILHPELLPGHKLRWYRKLGPAPR